MKYLALILLFPAIAHAHPVDELCGPGLDTDDGCQVAVHVLGLDDPDIFHAHKDYWHCRRFLVSQDTNRLGQCVGAVKALAASIGINYTESPDEHALLTYWNLIPAHPEFDQLDTGNKDAIVNRIIGQTSACNDTRAVAAGVILACEAKANWLRAVLKQRLRGRR